MAGICRVDIVESAEELRSLLIQQTTVRNYTKVQTLYLLKIGHYQTVKDLATAVGRDRTTLQRWLHTYRHQGIYELLRKRRHTMNKSNFSPWMVKTV